MILKKDRVRGPPGDQGVPGFNGSIIAGDKGIGASFDCYSKNKTEEREVTNVDVRRTVLIDFRKVRSLKCST